MQTMHAMAWTPEPRNRCVTGRVIWYHPELRFAFIESASGLTLGTIDRGQLDLYHEVRGDLGSVGPTALINISTGKEVVFDVEADALSEDQANELLGLVQG
jgi:hypothetical protein